MEKPVLCDPEIYPTLEVLSSHLGKASASFAFLFDYNHTNFPEFTENWKYYNDGKSWLLNVSRKKKTVFWLSVSDGLFRTGFYLGAKAEQAVLDSKIPKGYKDQFMQSAGKKFRGISAIIKTKKDVDVYKILLALKMSYM